ncbi:MAG TPA: Fur family transcriptional regulator [Thermoleophilaceae bacterium]|nr:Fur family transcriptional regulator [Thermoleophilaceae bacterium]
MVARSHIPAPAADAWIERAESELRGAGHRSSAPRTAVLEQIAAQSCVHTAQEIADDLRAKGKRVGLATVYRTLDLLERLRLVQRLDSGGTSARYEAALPGGEHHHHHLICDRCGDVTPFEDPALEKAIASLSKRLDYRVGDHDVVLRGSCPRCAQA